MTTRLILDAARLFHRRKFGGGRLHFQHGAHIVQGQRFLEVETLPELARQTLEVRQLLGGLYPSAVTFIWRPSAIDTIARMISMFPLSFMR